MKNARAKRAKILFLIVKYANLWGFCCRRCRGCLSSLVSLYSAGEKKPIERHKTRVKVTEENKLFSSFQKNIIQFLFRFLRAIVN